MRSSPEYELAEYLLLHGGCFSDSSSCAEGEAASPWGAAGEADLFMVLESHRGTALSMELGPLLKLGELV